MSDKSFRLYGYRWVVLAVFMFSLTQSSPDAALLAKMKEKLGDKAELLRE